MEHFAGKRVLILSSNKHEKKGSKTNCFFNINTV